MKNFGGLSRARAFVLVVTPLVAVLVLVLGLRVGAKGSVRAATVWGAPPAKAGAGAQSPRRGGLAWQVVTFIDDRGVREAVRVPGLSVTATTKDGKSATFRGDTNADGVAELNLDLPVAPGSEVHVVVTAEGERLPLAEGDVRVPSGRFGPEDTHAKPSRSTKRTGVLAVDLFVTDERLVVGHPVPVVVRVQDESGKPVDGAEVSVTPEPGLDAKPFSRTCKVGYSFGELIALFHTVGLSVAAKSPDGKEGTLFAALPVAHGANLVDAPRDVEANTPFQVTVRAPATRDVAYLEIDDAEGRAFGTTLVLRPDRLGPSATFLAPPLAEGRYWIVTSGDPRGAERIEDSTVARALRVHKGASPSLGCEERADLAMHPGGNFTRTELLDGLPSRRRDDTKRGHVGIGMGLVALLAAAIIEVILALQAVRDAQDTIERAMREAEGGDATARVTKKGSAGSVIVGLAIVVLGFALLAVLLVWKT